ncbi:Gfo/Idh/MocA family protein [Rosettibacter firmus]|uniref:Gfo/Idh/MocA family protein n=1 Tax=Rosettibacter firmus TaxID=3111522 RepID=UPI00336C050C
MDKTRIGIIGLGSIAQLVHLPILSRLENVDLVALSEINKNRLRTIGERFPSASKYQDYKEMISNENLDAVVIATPTDTHHEIALNCLKANINVLIEKPITINYDEAREINAVAKKHKKIAMVGMNLRFRPDAMLTKSIINSGELGDLFFIKCSWLREKSSNQKWFINKKQSGGGVIIDLGIVLLDLALWMFDDEKIESVSVQKYNHTLKDIEESAIGLIRFEDGKIITFEVSWELHSESDSFSMSIHGTKGTAHLNPLRIYKKMESGYIDYTPSKTSTSNLYRKSYENELKHFIGAIRENIQLISSSEESLIRMKLLEAIYKSAKACKEIRV